MGLPPAPHNVRRGDILRKLVAAAIFYMLSVLLSPVMLLSYLTWIGRLLMGRRSGILATAQGPLSARWVQHRLVTRRDEPAHRLLMVLPGVSPLAVRLLFGPLLLAHRLSGYVPRTFRYPFEGEVTLQNQASARQTFYDSVVDRYLPHVAQLVILGAGFDTRAFRLPDATRLKFGVGSTPPSREQVAALLQECGLSLDEHRTVGQETGRKRALGGFATAVVR